MTKVLVDIDDSELERAKQILGTAKNTEAVRRALHEVIRAQARRDLLAMLDDGAFADLGDPEVMAKAWSCEARGAVPH